MSNPLNRSFSDAPVAMDMSRSSFKRPSSHKTSFNEGELIPIYVDEILPGDTVSMDMASLVRMSTPVFPVMDNAFIDTYFFFVPNRLLWDHWKEFEGENTSAPWTQTTEYSIPQATLSESFSYFTRDDFFRYSLYDYMGLPLYASSNEDFPSVPISVSALPFRAYYLIWNEWFRNENLQYPINVYKGDSDQYFYDTTLTNNARFGYKPLKVGRYPDYFSTCLPQPQKGPDVLLPLGEFAPITAGPPHDMFNPDYSMRYQGQASEGTYYDVLAAADITPDGTEYTGNRQLHAYAYPTTQPSVSGISLSPSNLYADLAQATASTVNQLREAFAVQRMYERDAIGGTRYREILKSHFGVTSPDARMQIPEFLGSFRQPISIDQVVQTSQSDSTPQGNTSAYSLTRNVSSMFTKSFLEHGYLIGLACVRVEHSYSQGIERFWSRKRRFEFYDPLFANLGNMSVLKKEIMYTGSDSDDAVFGYQEAWNDYRYKPNRCSADFKASVNDGSANVPLLPWIYSDLYEALPSLSVNWFVEQSTNVGNTLASLDTTSQFIADFYFDAKYTRPMPLYSVPGLIDHH